MLTHSLIQYLTLPATPPSPVALAAGVRFIHKARLYEREIKDSLAGLLSFWLFGKRYWQAGSVCRFGFLRIEHPLG